MAVDYELIRRSALYQTDLVLPAIREILYKPDERGNLAVELPRSSLLVRRLTHMKISRVAVATTGTIAPKYLNMANFKDDVKTAINNYSDYLGGKQIQSEHANEIAALSVTKAGIDSL